MTATEQVDELTGLTNIVIEDPKKRAGTSKDLIPQIRLMGKKQLCFANTDIPADYQLPAGAIVSMGVWQIKLQ